MFGYAVDKAIWSGLFSSSEGYKEELNQKEFPLIRHIKIERKINSLPQNNLAKQNGMLQKASTIGDFLQ